MVYEVTAPDDKRRIAREVLADLPEWFGIPESAAAYVEESVRLPFYAAESNGTPVGFIVLKPTSAFTAELCVMGVKKAFHRRGVGTALGGAFLDRARQEGFRFAQVKTVAAGLYPEYDATRLFYERMGFCALEVFPQLWDEANPCLIMVRGV